MYSQPQTYQGPAYNQEFRCYSAQPQAGYVQTAPYKTWPTSYERSTLNSQQGGSIYRHPTVQSGRIKVWRRTPLSVWAAAVLSILALFALVVSFSTPNWRKFRAYEQSQPLERFEGLWLYCVWRSDMGIPLLPHYVYQCYTIINRDVVEIFDQGYMHWIRGFTVFGLLFALIGAALSGLYSCSRNFQSKRRNAVITIGFHAASVFLYGILTITIYAAKSIEEGTKGRMVNLQFDYSFFVGIAGVILQISTIFCHVYDLCRSIPL